MSITKALVVGAGLSGATAARALAETGFAVTVLERQNYAGGTVSDYKKDDYYVQRHGPHLFHTNNLRAYEFLSRFTEWYDYRHRVRALVEGKYIPVPFNFASLEALYPAEQAKRLEEKLTNVYGADAGVPIAKLGESDDEEIKSFADFVYTTVFRYYSAKQWGLDMSTVDPSVLTRVPVRTGYADGYFSDTYQAMPKDGFTSIVQKMLAHENITVRYETDATNVLKVSGANLKYEGKDVDYPVVFTGCVDELFGYAFGALPYRTLRFETEEVSCESYQPYAVVNYTVSESFTRISEFKKFTAVDAQSPGSVIVREYPRDYIRGGGLSPYYPLPTAAAKALYAKYGEKAQSVPHLYPLGRLGKYVYINMDRAVAEALDAADTIAAAYGRAKENL